MFSWLDFDWIFLTVPLLIVLGGGAIVWVFVTKQRNTSKQLDEINKLLSTARDRVIVVTTNDVPGRKINTVLGNVTGFSREISSNEEFRLGESEALLDLIANAIKMKANAVVDLKISTGSYEATGSKWMVSKIVYTGTAVSVN